MPKLSIHSLPVDNQRVLLRADLNCPLDDHGEILDDTRIRATLPTLRYLLDHNAARIIVISHLGRPEGQFQSNLSLAPIQKRLSELLNIPVRLVSECTGPFVEDLSKEGPEKVLLLENIRFEPAEEHPELNPGFAKNLARLGDCFVNDAFGTAHRRHSSTVDVAQYFPGKAAAGLLMEKELQFLEPILSTPKHPFVVVLAGGKVSSKVGVIRTLIKKADTLCFGGAMAQTFLAARGLSIGKAAIEADALDLCRSLEKEAADLNCGIFLPLDLTYQVPHSSVPITLPVGAVVPPDWIPKDLGPKTVKCFEKECLHAATILWNGPVGVIEEPPFDRSTRDLARAISQCQGITIAGGGHTVAAIEEAGLEDQFSHVSTGGGAMLELLELGALPGIDALTDVN